MVTKSKNS